MPSYPFTIKVGSPRSGQVVIQGREVSFYEGSGPDEQHAPLHVAAMNSYLADGTTAGVVTVTAASE